MASSITTPISAAPTFNGTSTYASSLQQVIDKAVQIASVPMQQLENDQTTVSSKVTAAQSLQSVLTALNTSLSSLSSSNANTVTASVSDPSVISATASAGALPATYTIDVTDPGSYTTAMSPDGLPTVSDPTSQNISSSSTFTLTVGSNTYNLTPSGDNLDALVQAINSSGAGVEAAIVNVGPPEAPDYRLAVQGSNVGSTSVSLSDGGATPLLNTMVTGTNALYTVNGQPSGGISSDSNTVTIAPGVTATLEGTGTSTLSVSLNASTISSALSAFVTAFNNVQSTLQQSYGQNANALDGDTSVLTSSQDMSAIGNYQGTGPGSIQSLSDLGVEFTQTGTLTFDPTKLSAMSSSQIADALSFLGDPLTSGFLQSATNTLNSLIDPTNGIITNEISDLTTQYNTDGTQILADQTQVNNLEANLNSQMSAADAQIASLQQQQQYLAQLFATTNANNNANI